ncbi:hypothetical protein IFVP182_C260294 [Vibrio parahaemolyticus]
MVNNFNLYIKIQNINLVFKNIHSLIIYKIVFLSARFTT